MKGRPLFTEVSTLDTSLLEEKVFYKETFASPLRTFSMARSAPSERNFARTVMFPTTTRVPLPYRGHGPRLSHIERLKERIR